MQAEIVLSSIEDRERLINKLVKDVDQLTKQNARLRQQVRDVMADCEQYREVLNNDPLYHIFEGELNVPIEDRKAMFPSRQQQEELIKVYQDRLQVSESKVHLLQARLNMKEQHLLNQKRTNLKLVQSEADLKRQLFQQTQELQVLRTNQKHWEEMMEQNQHRINKIMKRFEDFRNQIQNTILSDSQYIYRIVENNNSSVDSWSHVIDKIYQVYQQDERPASHDHQKMLEMNKCFLQHQQIMEDMGKELDQRNEDLTRLLMLEKSSHQEKKPQYKSAQHSALETLECYRSRERKHAELLAKFQQMVAKFEKSLQEKKILEKEYNKLNEQFKTLKEQSNDIFTLRQEQAKYKNLYETTKRQLELTDSNTIALLEQNQVFHELMYEIYGQKTYQDRILEERKKYQRRRLERESNQVWANVQELVNMNRKLKEKLTKK